MTDYRFVEAHKASVGALFAEFLGRSALVFGCGVLGVGVLSAVLRLDRPANRFAAIAFTIVLLVPYANPPWVVALHRFVEVSAGILIGLVLTAVWPESRTKNA